MLEKPPKWKDRLNITTIQKGLASKELQDILRQAQDKYAYWDSFKHYPFPEGFSAVEAWVLLKFTHRQPAEVTPISSVKGDGFGFSITKSLSKKLSYIDTHTAGFITTLARNPNDFQFEKLLMSGLSEEAIASSQIEGANTTRKVAKEMIYSGRKPKTEGEQMIINNYRVMKKIEDWKNLDLSEKMLLEMQSMITDQVLQDKDRGRFRQEGDEIVVHDPLTGEIAHTPPHHTAIKDEIERLIAYANSNEDEKDFIHPVIKATILHFWLAYLHPFVDGNGRTSRAIFYWYLIKNGYWLFQYLSVSRVIKNSRKKYDDAFLMTENDDNDLTYFLIYIIGAVCKAVQDMKEYYEKKVIEEKRYRKIAQQLRDLNERQIAVLTYFKKHLDGETDIQTHQSKHGIAYETARTDLMNLVSKGYLAETTRSNKRIFLPNSTKLKRLVF